MPLWGVTGLLNVFALLFLSVSRVSQTITGQHERLFNRDKFKHNKSEQGVNPELQIEAFLKSKLVFPGHRRVISFFCPITSSSPHRILASLPFFSSYVSFPFQLVRPHLPLFTGAGCHSTTPTLSDGLPWPFFLLVCFPCLVFITFSVFPMKAEMFRFRRGYPHLFNAVFFSRTMYQIYAKELKTSTSNIFFRIPSGRASQPIFWDNDCHQRYGSRPVHFPLTPLASPILLASPTHITSPSA